MAPRPLGLRPRPTVRRKTGLYKYLDYYFNTLQSSYKRHLATLNIIYDDVIIVSADQLWCARYTLITLITLISVLIYNSAYNLLDKLTSVCTFVPYNSE